MQADYVVVGAGSAGCTVVARLSESGASVIVLEAGASDWYPFIHIPADRHALYEACSLCDRRAEHSDKLSDSHGRCLPKHSLRGSEQNPDDGRRDEAAREAGERAARREVDEKERRRRQFRNWLESDVSGFQLACQ